MFTGFESCCLRNKYWRCEGIIRVVAKENKK